MGKLPDQFRDSNAAVEQYENEGEQNEEREQK